MQPRVISLVRYGLLGFLLFLSVVTLGLAAHLVSTVPAGGIVADWAALALAISLITIVALVPILAIDIFRKGAFTSMVAFELGWSFVLMVLWIASAGETTAVRAGVPCTFDTFDEFGDVFTSTAAEAGQCHEAQAIIAFGWLNFFILFAWAIMLLVLTITSHTRGNTGVWTQPVTGTDFFARKEGMGQPQTPYAGMPQNVYGTPAMQQQYGGAPMQSPYTGTPGQQYTPPPQQQQTTYPPAGVATV